MLYLDQLQVHAVPGLLHQAAQRGTWAALWCWPACTHATRQPCMHQLRAGHGSRQAAATVRYQSDMCTLALIM